MKVFVIDKVDQYILDLSLGLTKNLGLSTIIQSDLSKLEKSLLEFKNLPAVILNQNLFSPAENENLKLLIQKILPEAKVFSRYASDLWPNILDPNLEKSLHSIATNIPYKDFKKNPDKFVPISIEKLLSIEPNNLGCDLYIKILKNGTNHYVKRLHSTDLFSRNDILKYIQLGLKEFYVPEEQYEHFINILTIELIKAYQILNGQSFIQSERKEKLDFFYVNSTAHDVIAERINLQGVDDLTSKLVQEFTHNIEKSIEDKKQFYHFYQHLSDNKHSLHFTNSFLLAFFCYQLTMHYGWNSETSRTTMIYLALFHDIGLKDPQLIKLRSCNELESLESFKQEEIIQHADRSAAILEKFPNIPFGLTQLVREHHGQKDGINFPKHLSLNVSPMAMNFILLEELSLKIIDFIDINRNINEKDLKKGIHKIVDELKLHYSKLLHQKMVASLSEFIETII